MGVESTEQPNRKNDHRIPRFCLPSEPWKLSRYFKIMTGIIFVALQILLLLLRAHFNRNNDHNKAMEAIREAQGKLAELAAVFETQLRYSAPSVESVNHLQDR